MERVRNTLAQQMFMVPWQMEPPVGIAALIHPEVPPGHPACAR